MPDSQNSPQSSPQKPPVNGTFVGSIVFIDIVDYSKKTVSEQILIRERFKGLISASLEGIDAESRLVLDTGDGAAISFLGELKDALTVSVRMRDYLRLANGASVAEAQSANLNRTIPIFNYTLRIGINLGPVKLQQDNHGHPQIVGDGINVAQRITSFAQADQIVVSQSYFDAISAISAPYAKLLSYEGPRTDKNVRAHEIYVVGDAADIAGLTEPSTNSPKSTDKTHKALNDETRERKAKSSTTSAGSNKRPSAAATPIPFMQDRNKLLLTGSVLAFVVAGLFIVMAIRKPASKGLTKTGNTPEEIARDKPTPDLAPPIATAATVIPPAPIDSPPVTNSVTNSVPANIPDSAAAMPTTTGEKSAAAPTASVPGIMAKTVAKPAARPTVVQGTVSFSIQPWGDVYVNGRSVGASPPLKQSKLAPGTYRIEVKNTTFAPYTASVEVKSQENVSIKHRFQ